MFPNFYSSWNSKLRLQTWRFVFGIDASFPNFCSSWNSKLGLETWPMLCFEVKTIQIWNFVSDLLLQLTFSPSFPKQKPRLPNWTFFFSRIKASILEASSLSHNLGGNEASNLICFNKLGRKLRFWKTNLKLRSQIISSI